MRKLILKAKIWWLGRQLTIATKRAVKRANVDEGEATLKRYVEDVKAERARESE